VTAIQEFETILQWIIDVQSTCAWIEGVRVELRDGHPVPAHEPASVVRPATVEDGKREARCGGLIG
jgi:hypothetical protein